MKDYDFIRLNQMDASDGNIQIGIYRKNGMVCRVYRCNKGPWFEAKQGRHADVGVRFSYTFGAQGGMLRLR